VTAPRAAPHHGAIVGWLAVCTLLSAIAGILGFSAGIADPFPARLAAAPYPAFNLTTEPGTPAVRWFDAPVEANQVRLAADPGASAAEVALLVGLPERHLAIAYSNEGYAAVWLFEEGARRWLLPWQAWPHVLVGAGIQEIHVTLNGEMATAWLNREELWSGVIPVPGFQVGVQAAAREETTTVKASALTVEAR
jgi:hypothetical protein